MLRKIGSWGGSVALVYALVASAHAAVTEVNINGSIKGMQGNVMLVESSTGDKWRVLVSPKAAVDVTYTGTAEPSYLHPGLPVKFNGKFNGKLMGQEPVAELEVYGGNEFGIQDENAAAASLLATPGEKPKREKPAPIDPTAINTYTVQGVIKSVKNGKMMVSAGNKTLSCDLAETAAIKVDVSGPAVLKFLQPGDNVDISRAKSEGPGVATAENAKITGGKPLAGKTSGKPFIASKPLAPEKTETEKKPEETKPEEKKPEGEAKPGEAKPEDAKAGEKKPDGGFKANPLFDNK